MSDDFDYEAAIATYDKVMSENYAQRVDLMPSEDLKHYFQIHNLPSPEKQSVLSHMSRWGGFQSLVLKEGLKVFERSALLQRIISGKPPLAFAPPRKQGIPWYELFDEPGLFPCEVNGVFKNRRTHRHTWKELIMKIEDCPWEVVEANPKAGSLLDAQVRFQYPESSTTPGDPVFEATQIARATDGLSSVTVPRAEICIRHGKWPHPFTLVSTGVTPLGDSIQWPLQAVQWAIDSRSR